MEEGVGAVALHGHDVEVAAKVPRVAARDREAVPEPRERRIRAVVAGGAEGGGVGLEGGRGSGCLLYTSPSPRDRTRSRMPSSA